MISIDSLKLLETNPRKISESEMEQLKKSLETFTKMLVLRPMIADENRVIIGGNQRLKALIQLGYKEIPDEWVKFVDDYTEAEKKEFIIRDNVSNGSWDEEEINSDYWNDVPVVDWADDVLKEILAEHQQENITETNIESIDEEPQEPAKTDIVEGDIITIGRHKLICGDSTDEGVYYKLLNGKLFDVCVTSPPYNQGGRNSDYTKEIRSKKNKTSYLYTDKNQDNKSKNEYFDFINSVLNNLFIHKNEKHSIIWNVSYNAKSRDDYGKILFSETNPFAVKETIVWDKRSSVNLQYSGIYSRRCEFIFVMSSCEKYLTTHKDGEYRWNYYPISAANSSVTDEGIEHHASFPIKLVEQIILDFVSSGNIVLDCFCGSGKTMIGCEMFGGDCYGIEKEPIYCQLIINRMKKEFPEILVTINGKQIK